VPIERPTHYQVPRVSPTHLSANVRFPCPVRVSGLTPSSRLPQNRPKMFPDSQPSDDCPGVLMVKHREQEFAR
jgi:hypothetical protein